MINKIIKIFEKNKDLIAYKVNSNSITYEKLLKKSIKYSKLLRKQGTEPVVIYGHKSIEMVISIISCLFANRTYIPIDTCTPIERIKKIILLTNASLLISNELIDLNTNIEVLTLNKLNKYAFKEAKNCQKNQNAYIIFTSGSTGDPKGVPITYSNLNNFIKWISNFNPLNEYKNINVLNQASFSFDLSVADFYYSLFNGHTLIGLDKKAQENYEEIFNLIKVNNINLMVMTPTFMKLCLLNNEFNSFNYPSLKCLYFCGEILDKKTVNKIYKVFPDIKVINAYGPTEATSAVTAILLNKEMLTSELSLPVGDIKTSATKIEIVNGEIVLEGKSVFSGYLNNIEGGYFCENNENCYKTGDLGFIKDEKLYYIGRTDNQIKYKGYRIELADIEENINKIKGVIDCAVVSKLNCDSTVKTIKAFVVLELNCDESYIKRELEKLIPKYMMPKIIKIIEKLPINQNGKIDRKLLSDL